MKNTFVLDENVLIKAHKPNQRGGGKELAPGYLLYSIAFHCHRIAIDVNLIKRYFKQLSRGPGTSASLVMLIVRQILANSKKHVFANYIPKYPFEDGIPDDDRAIVRLAVRCKAILVTLDLKLKEAICKLDLEKNYGIKVLDPTQAAEYAH